MTTQPSKKVKQGSISVARFENVTGSPSFVVQKSYKSSKTGEWVNSSLNLFETELDLLQKAIAEMKTK